MDIDSMNERNDWITEDGFRSVMSSHLSLSQIGSRRLLALCPFHSERTPSFTVFLDTRSYYCFGCKASGDLIRFLMNYNGWSFSQTMTRLNNDWGLIPPVQEGNSQLIEIRKVMDKAQEVWRSNLIGTYGHVIDVGLSPRELELSEAGLANQSSNSTIMRFHKRESLILSGLMNEQSRHLLFNQRVTFPLRSSSGAIIAFQARTLLSGSSHKYITTRNTLMFTKSKYVYGMDKLPKNVRDIIVTEGIKDAIKLRAIGFSCVSLLGSAISDDQMQLLLKLLNHRDSKLYLMLDADEAGHQCVTEIIRRGLAHSAQFRFQVKICLLERGLDPSDLCDLGSDAVEKVLHQSLDLSSWRKLFINNSSVLFMGKTTERLINAWIKDMDYSLPLSMKVALSGFGLSLNVGKRFPTAEELTWSGRIMTLLRLKGLMKSLRDGSDVSMLSVSNSLVMMNRLSKSYGILKAEIANWLRIRNEESIE